jgi:hypothetical protein
MTSICKRSFLMEVVTLLCLNKYFLKERKYNNILKCSENIYAIENEDYEHLFWRSHGVFIAHESCSYIERKDWSVVLSLWYFKM